MWEVRQNFVYSRSKIWLSWADFHEICSFSKTFVKNFLSNFMIIRQVVDTRLLSNGPGFHIQQYFLLHTKQLTTQKSIILIFTALQILNLIYEHLCFCKVAQFYCVGRNNNTCYNNHFSYSCTILCLQVKC